MTPLAARSERHNLLNFLVGTTLLSENERARDANFAPSATCFGRPSRTNATTGSAGWCACTASGQTAVAPPSKRMKWRRLIASPMLRHDIIAIWAGNLAEVGGM
jgi:hypothetical protein